MWKARLELKKATSDDGKALESILYSLTRELEQVGTSSTSCSCVSTLASCGSYRDELAREFPEENGESSWRRTAQFRLDEAGEAGRKLLEYTQEGARYAAERGWLEFAIRSDKKVCSSSKIIVRCGFRKV